jgi:hypothetical protein
MKKNKNKKKQQKTKKITLKLIFGQILDQLYLDTWIIKKQKKYFCLNPLQPKRDY